MRPALRPTRPEDREILLAIYASTRAEELALTTWDDTQKAAFVQMQFNAQERHYTQHYPQSQCQLILSDDAVVGRLWVDRRRHAVHVLDISLLAPARGFGLGTQCLRALMQEAGERQVPLTIYVELHNPARRLYERLGFRPVGEPEGLYQSMSWQTAVPAAAQPAPENEECLS